MSNLTESRVGGCTLRLGAQRAGVHESGKHPEAISEQLRAVQSMKAVFDSQYAGAALYEHRWTR